MNMSGGGHTNSDRRTRKRKHVNHRSWVNDTASALLLGDDETTPKTGYVDTVTGATLQGLSYTVMVFVILVVAALVLASWGLSRTSDNARAITMVNETLYSNITAINSTIDTLNMTLTMEIDTVNTTLTMEIEATMAEIVAVNTSLCDKVMMLETQVDQELAMLEMLANMTSEDFMQFLMNATQMFTELNEEVQTLNTEVAVLQDPDVWQVRVNGSCTEVDGSIQAIHDDGSVTCFVGAGNDTVMIDASAVVSGQFADARISSSSVLQYESLFNHFNILNIGVNTHAQIDTFIANIDTTIDARIAAASIGDLADVDTTTTTPTIGDTLEWDGSDWVPGTNLIELNNTIETLQEALNNVTQWTETTLFTGTCDVQSSIFMGGNVATTFYLKEATFGIMTIQYIEIDPWSVAPSGTDWTGNLFVQFVFQGLQTTIAYGAANEYPIPPQQIGSNIFSWVGATNCQFAVFTWLNAGGSGVNDDLVLSMDKFNNGMNCLTSGLGTLSQLVPFRINLPMSIMSPTV